MCLWVADLKISTVSIGHTAVVSFAAFGFQVASKTNSTMFIVITLNTSTSLVAKQAITANTILVFGCTSSFTVVGGQVTDFSRRALFITITAVIDDADQIERVTPLGVVTIAVVLTGSDFGRILTKALHTKLTQVTILILDTFISVIGSQMT